MSVFRLRFIGFVFSISFSFLLPSSYLAAEEVEVLRLPPEQSVFGLQPAQSLPNSEDRRYLSLQIQKNPAQSFNNKNVETQSVLISGKTIVFEPDHGNGLWNYHDNKTTRDLTIHAETVIIRAVLNLPQTNLTIHARELRFEDQPGQPPASISTLPDSISTLPEQFEPGSSGLKAGDITLHIDSFTADAHDSARFILRGGNGQDGGKGKTGKPGRSLKKTWSGKFCRLTKCYIFEQEHKAIEASWYKKNGKLAKHEKIKPPTSGDPAKPGGKPGNGGAGGVFSATLDLAAYADLSAGNPGKGYAASGGRAGTPRRTYHYRCTWDDGCKRNKTHSTKSGKRAAAPTAAPGTHGEFRRLQQHYSWLTPFLTQHLLRYLRDVYQQNHYATALTAFSDYRDILNTYRASGEWSMLSPQDQAALIQSQDSIRLLLAQLQNQLDYFGNPAGWVPMLSFEVNKAVFEYEVDQAMRVLFLHHWLRTRASNKQQQIATMKTLRKDLLEEIKSFEANYNQAMDALPWLQAQADDIAQDIADAKNRIEQMEQELMGKAREAAFVRQLGTTLTAAAEQFPGLQPAVGFAGEVIYQIPDIDPEQPVEKSLLEITKTSALETFHSYQNGIDDSLDAASELSECNNARLCLALEGAKRLNELREPGMDLLGRSVELLSDSQTPSPAVEAELARLLAQEPEAQAIYEQLQSLDQKKANFAIALTEAYRMLATLANDISANLLTVDALDQSIFADTQLLNPRLLSYLDDMRRRALDRLQEYHYYLVKAYEYRLLKPYPAAPDLTEIFKEIETLANNLNDVNELSADHYDSLRTIFEEQIADISAQIFRDYNQNRPEMSAPVRFFLNQKNLDQLNRNHVVSLDLTEQSLFTASEENLRIVDLKLDAIELDYQGPKQDIRYIEFCLEHGDVSRLLHNGESYLFRHHSTLTTMPIVWCSRYDPVKDAIDPVKPSAASESLLMSLLSRRGIGATADNLLLYSRPAAWTELKLYKIVRSVSGSDVIVKNMRWELIYDFVRTPLNRKTLQIKISNPELKPLITLNKADQNQRQNGWGRLLRSFPTGDSVTLSAPESYGDWQFVGWRGAEQSETSEITLKMDRDYIIEAHYLKR